VLKSDSCLVSTELGVVHLRKLYTEPSIGAYYQISINLAKNGFRDFKKLANHKHELPMVAIFVV
jgi:hypothetical protein